MSDGTPKSSAVNLPEGADGMLEAPLLYADWIGGFGHVGQVVNLTLCAHKHLSDETGNLSRRYVVAHLRMPFQTALAIKDAIEKVELSLKPTASVGKN
jgi:hypothetical protein